MKENRKAYWFKLAIIFGLGFIGVLSALPIIPKLITLSGQRPPLPMPMLLLLSTIQSSAFVIGMVFIGSWVAPKINLGTPLIDAYINKASYKNIYGGVLLPGILAGLIGGVLLLIFSGLSVSYLPSEFIDNAKEFNPPVYAKLLYGGITEEILIRYGLMSLFAWGIYRSTQKHNSPICSYNYILAILFSSLLFGVAHLPAAGLLSPVVTNYLFAYIVIGNSIFGLISGYLYWKRGLETAILSHMVAHIVMIIGDKIA